MSGLPEPIVRLTAALRRLPGIGPRSAERIALHIVQSPVADATELAGTIQQARERTRLCSTCGSLTEVDPCAFCTDARREDSLLCVVERPTDILSLERSAIYRGRYHVLGGRIAPLVGVGPEDLRITELEQRIKNGKVMEVIIALGTDVEGDATGHYLAKRLATAGVRITRIAHGLPAGSGLEFADEVTLARALEGRREF